ncbi:MAG: hypothetical protein Q8N77_06190 [Nanoarchaeota archaeon]|nr:hypothetical protein [Nanoarchaeota archaeon]
MDVDLVSGLTILFAVIICIIVYLVIENVIKFVISIRFISRLVRDFKAVNKKYMENTYGKVWNPWKY